MTSMLKRFARPLAAFAFLLVPFLAPAQAPGSGLIAGRVIDANTGEGLSDVAIQVVGTTLGTTSGIEGRYHLGGVPAGTVTLQVRRIGFQPKTLTGLVLEAGGRIEQDIAMVQATIVLRSEVVTAAAERGTVNAALDRQRTATGIVNSVTAEQISRSPDGDAAQAVQRVSGVTVEDGKYVFVRGLGERYTTASLNGARLPSPEPEKRVVPLDLFPSGLLQTVTTSKTFTPDQPGDFSGASVDIQTREFPARRQFSYSLAVGANDAATRQDIVSAPRLGTEWLGIGTADRAIPSAVLAIRNRQQYSQNEVNDAVASLRNQWSAVNGKGAANVSASASVGGNDALLGRNIGYIGSLSYSYGQEAQVGREQRWAQAVGTDGRTVPVNEFRGSTGRSSVLWGGLFNLSTLVGARTRLALNNTYARSGDNEASVDEGFDEDNYSLDIRRTTLRYVERTVRSHQLVAEHEFGARHRADVAATWAEVSRDEPDRSDFAYARPINSGEPFRWYAENPDGAKRTFAALDETSSGLSANYRWMFGNVARQSYLKAGATLREVRRDADNTSYSVTANTLPLAERERPIEEIFDGRHTEPGDEVFFIQSLAAGGSYTVDNVLGAGYAMAELALGERVRLIGGARVEDDRLDVTVFTIGQTGGASVERNRTDVLPSLALNYRLSEMQNLRLSATRTLSRPEYREIVPIVQRNGLAQNSFRGNADIRRTLIENYDIRWEWYPNAGELLSVALFGKRFHDPIEEVEVPSSGAPITTWVNEEGAVNYGVELEARKSLGMLNDRLAPFTAFANVTLMRSEIRADEEQTVANTSDRPMVGQAPYVVNAGLTWSGDRGASGTVLYNVVGERISAVATPPLPAVYERPRHVLDLSVRLPMTRTVALRLDGKNLLDSEYVQRQGDVIRERYRAGRTFSAGLNWSP